MRLLNTTTLQLEEFFDERDLKYAILSHRWENEEVSFQDMQNGTATKKKGYAKIKMTCEQALRKGLPYAWVDTCCIDKTSSAELTESINSMYRWYEGSVVCYAYLSDVKSNSTSEDASFQESKWFTRGWTLQELIAPSHVEFYNVTWKKLGTRKSLMNNICAITGIDRGIFSLERRLSDFSIAKRMSWASKRTTTRVEDMAYCLLGIFRVNMPMLYGEGERAFLRLQEEIMKNSDDQSLFAWEMAGLGLRGLLANSPAAFGSCSNIVCSKSEPRLNRVPYFATNMGLSIELLMIPWAMNTYLAALDCEVEDWPNSRVGIFLKIRRGDQFARCLVKGKDSKTFKSELVTESEYRKIYVQLGDWLEFKAFEDLYGFWIRSLPTKICTNPTSEGDQAVSEVTCWNKWSDEERIIKIPTGSRGTAGVLWYKIGSGYHALKLGFDSSFNPVCQFGGPISTAKSKYNAAERNSFAAKMDPEWMHQESDWVFKGNRLSGLNEERVPRRISIKKEFLKFRGKYMEVWAVDIELMKAQNTPKYDFTCDICGLAKYDKRYKCPVCPKFKCCSKCISIASETHGSHELQAVEA